eukprot:9136654-Pyramimonas_sp.AAC.1
MTRVYRRLGEGVTSKWNGESPYREIYFAFVFVPRVRARRRRVGGREEMLLWLGRDRTKCIRVPAVSRRWLANAPVSRWIDIDKETDNEIDCGIDSEIDNETDSEIDREIDCDIDIEVGSEFDCEIGCEIGSGIDSAIDR